MRSLKRADAKRTAAGVLGLLLLLIVLFSAFFIALEADHDCAGEDCPVCAGLELCENTLRRIGDEPAAFAPAVLPVFFACFAAVIAAEAVRKETPVSRKVRLND